MDPVEGGGGGAIMGLFVGSGGLRNRWYAGTCRAVVSVFYCICILLSVCAHSPSFSLCLLHRGCRVPPVHTGSRLDGPPSSSSSASASTSASAATTAAKSTLQVTSPSLATLRCLAPAGSDSGEHSSAAATLDTRRSVRLCDSYENN